jgi:NADH dehydrogenase FAD-containing subunit
LRTQTKLMDVTQDYAIVVKDGREQRLAFDTLVLSLGTEVDTEAIDHFKTAVAECYVVGTSNGKSGTVWNATTSAYDAAMAV